MQKLCEALVRHRKGVISAFLVAAVLCAACIPSVSINYDLVDYLPESSPSTQAINGMQDAFDSDIPNVRLYVEGVDQSTAEELAEELDELEGVSSVMWAGDVFDMRQPREIAGDVLDDWVTDTGYLYQVSVDNATVVESVDSVRATAEDTGAERVSMTGEAVSTASTKSSADAEMFSIIGALLAIVIAILLLTSNSWFEPVIFLAAIGIAIVLNMGTNLVLGEISFVTQMCAAVLQLAVSMDYAIVLLHTFRRCQRMYDDPEQAMVAAMRKGFSVVLSSAAVTFFGFLSLAAMQFQIGVDMGIVLAKGIVMSFLTIMFFMPCLILACLRPLDALAHKSLVPSFSGFARVCTRIAVPMVVVVALVAVPSYLGESRTSFVYGSSSVVDAQSAAGQETLHIEEAFGAEDAWVVMVPEGRWAEEQALVDDLEALEHVTGVQSYLTAAGSAMPVEMVPEDTASQVISNGWSRLALTTDLSAESPEAFQAVEDARAVIQKHYGDDYLMAGQFVSTYDLKHTVEEDAGRVAALSLVSIAIVLALTFRSLSIPVLALLAIKVAIWINLAIPYFMGQELQYIGYLVIDAIQLGAAVDYAIIYIREYLDQRKNLVPADAMPAAIEHSAITILTSSSILMLAGICIFTLGSNSIMCELGMLIARGAFLSMLMMFVLLPFLFKTFDKIIDKTSWKLSFFKGEKGNDYAQD